MVRHASNVDSPTALFRRVVFLFGRVIFVDEFLEVHIDRARVVRVIFAFAQVPANDRSLRSDQKGYVNHQQCNLIKNTGLGVSFLA